MTALPESAAASADPMLDPTPTEAFRREAAPRRGFLFFLVLASVGAASAQMSVALLTLSLKANQIDADDATSILALASGIAGILALVGLPIVGRLSDQSRSRAGRRRPFLIAGAVAFALGAALMITATDAWSLTAANLAFTLGSICAGVITTALIADQLPANRRGLPSALISLSTPVGALLGIGLSQPFGSSVLALVLIPTALAVLGLVALSLFLRDPQFIQERKPFHLLELVGVFWVNPLRHPAFALAFASRMLVFSGVAAINAFQAIYLLDHLGFAPQELGSAILLTVLINTGVSLLVAPIMGKLSDRIGRRKPFVVIAAVILAIGLLLAASATTFEFYLAALVVVAIGQGVYFSVELALASQVLPDPDNPAKDLALINVANNLPVSIVAAVAPALLAVGVAANDPKNYSALFIAGAVSALIGAVAVSFIRSVR
ncbi:MULTISPECIES: MFS transporter [unclassified Rathayibacter]|uniref:MFS transporter n=1 Tax=unclassified Rathayibacter TaxID=2609250 RepID=UPI001044754F|nr:MULTISPECIES: MFS transporter [unclassified Rathayibacter]TCL79467.1 MFS transporter [Rathayibacter sp. PhB192]TCM25264.1 MFS transporter [Rathayibacter sp. PhB179]